MEIYLDIHLHSSSSSSSLNCDFRIFWHSLCSMNIGRVSIPLLSLSLVWIQYWQFRKLLDNEIEAIWRECIVSTCQSSILYLRFVFVVSVENKRERTCSFNDENNQRNEKNNYEMWSVLFIWWQLLSNKTPKILFDAYSSFSLHLKLQNNSNESNHININEWNCRWYKEQHVYFKFTLGWVLRWFLHSTFYSIELIWLLFETNEIEL